jgi:hypothetical protein
MLHILIGDGTRDVDSVLQAAKIGRLARWRVPKAARVNDRALFHLPRLGFTARGVIGSHPQQRRQYTPGRRYTAALRDVALLTSAVPLTFIRKNLPTWKWPTYPRSYVTIDGTLERRLEELLDSYQVSFAEPLTEGTSKTTSVTLYERSAIARQQCIAHHGTACYACGFSFGETYGETADGYIHVHHLKAVSKRGGKYVVNPIKDLRPICPNCHAVIHLRMPPLSILELRRMLKSAQ